MQEKKIRKKDPPVVLRMGETDVQGQKLSDTNNKKKGQIYVMLFVLSFVYWTGERYLNLETAKDMMFWKRGSVSSPQKMRA